MESKNNAGYCSRFYRFPRSAVTHVCMLQIVLEADGLTLSFGVSHVADLEAMVSHVTASLKRVFPDSSPR